MTIELQNITKYFGSKKVLDTVSTILDTGHIHALLGENGAGKSTLARILCGNIQADAGSLRINNKPVYFKNEGDAADHGIIQVHQTPLLAETLSVKTNILLGSSASMTYSPLTFSNSKAFLLQEMNNLIHTWAPHLNTKSLVKDTGGDGHFYTALLSALCRHPKLLILDEPGALLSWDQRLSLYANLRNLASQGMNILIITHNMVEAELYTDTITVLEHGTIAGEFQHSRDFDRTKFSFSNHIIKQSSPPAGSESEDSTAILFTNVSCRPQTRPALFNCTFSFSAGKITLIQGLPESGLGTLENIVTGMQSEKYSGTVRISASGHKQILFDLKKNQLTANKMRFPFRNIKTGIIPSNRMTRGAHPALTVQQMLTVNYSGHDQKTYTEKLIREAAVAIKPEDPVSALSGGMLQRLIFARELYGNPQFVIFCEPLQGLDSLAGEEACQKIYEAAKNGAAVLVLSAAGFPETFVDSFYSLDAGILKEKNSIHEN